MTSKRVLSVGQCYTDHYWIKRMLQQFDAELVAAATTAEALALLQEESFALILVNRVFDADETPGLDLIRRLKADAALQAVPLMLVSNYEDAQEEAVQAGALPGFGKSDLSGPLAADRVRPFLASPGDALESRL